MYIARNLVGRCVHSPKSQSHAGQAVDIGHQWISTSILILSFVPVWKAVKLFYVKSSSQLSGSACFMRQPRAIEMNRPLEPPRKLYRVQHQLTKLGFYITRSGLVFEMTFKLRRDLVYVFRKKPISLVTCGFSHLGH